MHVLGVASGDLQTRPVTSSTKGSPLPPGGGFFLGLVHGASEVISDVVDVARQYVPESIWEHLRESRLFLLALNVAH